MNPGSWIGAGAALACLAAGGSAAAQPAGATFSIRNDTGRAMECAIRKAGSTVSEAVMLRENEAWSRTYPKKKARNFRCLDANPVWYFLKPGQRYRLVKNRHGLIVLVPMA